jgi:hypothetical protein
LLGSDTLVAVTVTFAGDGTAAGAVYRPVEEIVPQVVPLQPVPDAVQVTAVFDVPVTEAANCWVAPVVTDTVAGVTATTTTCAAVPVPLRLTTAVLFVEELLETVSWPVAALAAVGSNDISTVVAWFGVNVMGSAGAENVKPMPVCVIPLIVTGAVPVEVKVIDFVVGVLTTTLPNATLAGLMLSASMVVFSCNVKLVNMLPTLAVIVTAWAVATEDALAVNSALAKPAGIVTVLGTVTVELLLDMFTIKPPLGAAAVSVTVQVSVPAPVMAPLLQDSRLNGGGVPVPLRLTMAVPLVEELLAIVSWPVAAPVAAGSNCTVRVSAWPGLSVAGRAALESVKPVPVSVTPLIVTGAVPVEVKVTGCVAEVLTTTLPNGTLAALMLSVGTAAFSNRAKPAEELPWLAVRIVACAVATEATVAVNPALAVPAGTVTVLGTVTAELLLDRLTVNPPLVAAAVSVTVQASVPAPVMAPLLQDSALNAAEPVPVVPVPLKLITGVPDVEELLAIVNCPVDVPMVAGLNCTFKV